MRGNSHTHRSNIRTPDGHHCKDSPHRDHLDIEGASAKAYSSGLLLVKRIIPLPIKYNHRVRVLKCRSFSVLHGQVNNLLVADRLP